MLNKQIEFAKVIRFDNKGFFTKPYNSSCFCHAFPFLDVEITTLTNNNQFLDNENMIIEPHFDDPSSSGCFAFLNEYNSKLFEEGGAMYFRSEDKKNTMYLNTEEVIWITEFYLTEKQVNRLINPFHMYKQHLKKLSLQLFNPVITK
ncbi:hypothetical protein [Bacillus pseudomycoides]|uniref:hypothetical protein n=1 Tax=Bacillus pseudomycoides TaxID=64104 RepID=UPI000BEB309F|nr:hypothetical protein [Bacillus pseudomycoides]PED08314.1 hypothetical protein COO19_10755 [Bacillus pseudomycoides]